VREKIGGGKRLIYYIRKSRKVLSNRNERVYQEPFPRQGRRGGGKTKIFQVGSVYLVS